MKSILIPCLGLLVVLPSCASGPVIPKPPTVRVAHFNSTRITPEGIQFVGKVVIGNTMRGPLEIEKVDYSADLHDRLLFDRSFSKLATMRARGRTTVTLPFHVSMQEITKQAEDLVAEGSVRVTLRGKVVPVGFASIPFEVTKVVPIPRPPILSLAGARGNPLTGNFTVFLSVQNTNSFPVAFGSVDTYVKLNGKKYGLLRGKSFSTLPPGGKGRVALTMRTTHRKGLGMMINVLKNKSADFAVGGMLSCKTPHGVIRLPVELKSTGAATPGR